MCRPLIFIVFQVLALENVATVPYYNNPLYYSPWYYPNMMMQNVRPPYQPTRGPVSFGGQVKAKGGVTITRRFGDDGYDTFASFSAPPSPLIVTSSPAFPTTSTSLANTALPTSTTLPTITTLPASTTLPTITTLPAVTLPPTTINQQFLDIVPSSVSVPDIPMSFIVVTTTVPDDVRLNGNVESPVKFSGMVPASGRVKISAHFC